MTGTQNPQTALEAAGEHPVATTVVVVVAFVTGVAVGLFGANVMTSGDEAPIRVRGGSMYFDILELTPTAKWEKRNQDTEWGISKGKRNNKTLRLQIEPYSSCPGAPRGIAKVDRLFVEYDDHYTVEIYSDGDKHLRLKPDDISKLQPSANADYTLEYGVKSQGFIQNLYKDSRNGPVICTFTADSKLQSLTVNDF